MLLLWGHSPVAGGLGQGTDSHNPPRVVSGHETDREEHKNASGLDAESRCMLRQPRAAQGTMRPNASGDHATVAFGLETEEQIFRLVGISTSNDLRQKGMRSWRQSKHRVGESPELTCGEVLDIRVPLVSPLLTLSCQRAFSAGLCGAGAGGRSTNHVPPLPDAPCADEGGKGGAGERPQGWRGRQGRAVSCLLPVPAGLTPAALPRPGKGCRCFPLDPVLELSTSKNSLITHPVRGVHQPRLQDLLRRVLKP